MENASKALLIAGGMLLSLLVIGLVLMLSNNIGGLAREREDRRAHNETVSFNRGFETYDRQLLTRT